MNGVGASTAEIAFAPLFRRIVLAVTQRRRVKYADESRRAGGDAHLAAAASEECALRLWGRNMSWPGRCGFW